MQLAMSTTLSRFLVLGLVCAWLGCGSICVFGQQSKFYPVVAFHTDYANQETYSKFIQTLRNEMGCQNTVYGIPQLRKEADWPKTDRFLLVTLYNSAGKSITLAINRVQANIVGYRKDYQAYFFPDTNAEQTSSVFSGIARYTLPFVNRYSAMEKYAGSTRRSINLGMVELDKAIQTLYDYKQDSSLGSSMLVAIQMVADAIRIRYVEKLVLQHITEKKTSVFLPTAAMIAFEDNWHDISSKIADSVGGVIYPPFMLPDGSNQQFPISSVGPTLRLHIAVILFTCHPAASIPPFPYPYTCKNIPEPTVQISGRNGLCADVQDGFFNDGDPIIMWPCTANLANQLWTLKRDGTIRSGGKCMTAYGLTAGQYVKIFNCSKAAPDATKWKIYDNGNIENTKSGLPLNAYTGSIRSVLTLDNKRYASRQGWRLGNNTSPVVTPITGYKGMCMQSSANNTVLMVECGNINVQKWQLYPDGTVRPSVSTTSCLASKSSQDGTLTLVLDSCKGVYSERWLFNHDSSISNVYNNYVLEVNKLKNIVVVKRSADKPTAEQTWSISTFM